MVIMAPAWSIVVAGTSLAAIVWNPTYFKNIVLALAHAIGYDAPGGLWRIAAILLALANIKNMPFVWHVRLPPKPEYPPKSVKQRED